MRRLAVPAFLGWVGLVGAGGCSDPAPITDTELSNIVVSGNVVTWTTDEPATGLVLYGAGPGAPDHVAYPRAVARGDKALLTSHQVPLLSVAGGDTVYFTVRSTAADGRIVGSEEKMHVVSAGVTPRARLAWTMIDVGFGDSHLLVMPSTGKRILVDAGERQDWPNVQKFLDGRGITRLDVLMGTHIHEDHIGGMVGSSSDPEDGVAMRYEVGLFLDSPFKSHYRGAYPELLGLLSQHQVPLDTVFVGDTDATNPGLDWDPQVKIEALNSGYGSSIGGTSEGDHLNNDSIMLRLSFGEVDLVMGGDSEGPVEARVLQQHGESLESEVLKVHHHGLDDTNNPGFIDAVNPRVGFIPIATYESNLGDLPRIEVVTRLRERSVDVYANDRAEPLGVYPDPRKSSGHNATLWTDGVSYEVSIVPSESRYVRP